MGVAHRRPGGTVLNCARCGLQAFGYRSCPGCGAPFAVTEEVGPLHGPGMPARRWELTAPESYLLRYADFGGDSEWHAFKVGLMELVARRVRGCPVARRT